MSFSVLFFFKQKTAYEMRISDWSSDVCSSDLALHIAQLALQRIEFVAVVDGHAFAEAAVCIVEVGAVGDDDAALDPFGEHLPRDVAGRERPVDRLSARHCDRVVEEDLDRKSTRLNSSH